MTRIFAALALVATLLLVTNTFLGLRIGAYHEAAERLQTLQQKFAQQRQRLPRDETRIGQLEGERAELYQQLAPVRRRATLHVLVGVLAALVTILVQSVCVTYFIGTSRWCREVVDAYQLDPQWAARSNRLKRRTFPWSLAGIGMVLLLVSTGAAADPATLRAGTETWVLPHFVCALTTVAAVAWALLIQWLRIGENAAIIEAIVEEVRRIRAERGLDKEELPRGGAGEGEPELSG